jgi:hypothetical protein
MRTDLAGRQVQSQGEKLSLLEYPTPILPGLRIRSRHFT